ncbi:MAG: hypothetical protein ABW106_01315 [Steroidobacteraceae bacterium]
MESTPPPVFQEGDRVCAGSRPGFPQGTVIRNLNDGYVLVRWDGDVLETAHHLKLSQVAAPPPDQSSL